jgi:hypothetical protein
MRAPDPDLGPDDETPEGNRAAIARADARLGKGTLEHYLESLTIELR